MSDVAVIDPSNVNPSQSGPAGITADDFKPVNANSAPQASQDVPPAEPSAPSGNAPEAQPNTGVPPKVETVPSTTDEAGVVVYDETGDAGLDFALSFIGSLGIAGNDPVMVAAANGDFSLLEAKLATLGDKAKGWERHVQLGKDAYTRQADKFKAEQTATNQAVYAIAGGEANWNALVAWAGKNAAPAEKQALNAMFDAGGVQAQMAARSILSAYQQAKGTTITPANPAANPGSVTAQPQARMTQADYHKEVSALFNKLGNAMDGSPEYADLRRRAFGR